MSAPTATEQAIAQDYQKETMSDLSSRMRAHVVNRGGLSKDANGDPVVSNGAWAMMLEAADEIERLNSALKEVRDFINPDAPASSELSTREMVVWIDEALADTPSALTVGK